MYNGDNFAKLLSGQKSLGKQTKKSYISCLRCLSVSEFDLRDIKKTYLSLLNRYSRKYASKVCSVLRLYYKLNNIHYKDSRLETYALNIKLKNAFTPEELKLLINNSDEFISSAIRILYATALRISELLKSELALQVNDDILEITFLGKSRRLPESVLMHVKDNSLRDAFYTFYNKKYYLRRRSKNAYHVFWKEFKKLKEKCDIIDKKKTIHSIRHSAAVSFYNKVKDIDQVRNFLRHGNIKTTMLYLNKYNTVEIKVLNLI
jgi:integrase